VIGWTSRTPDPYRLLFPLGVFYAIAGAVPWLLYAFGGMPWPGLLHRALMIEGFELCFVLGFLLTAIPAFTHGPRCTPLELAGALAGPLAFGLCMLLGHEAAALAAFTLTIVWLAVAAARRIVAATQPPPEEFQFVGLGLLLGLAGGVVQFGAALRWWDEPAPRLGIHLVSLGMVLALVLGVGTLLIPVFAGLRDPLVIQGIAGAHERHGRRALYATLAAVLALSFVAEGAGLSRLGDLLRALVASVFVALVWRLVRLPGRRALGAWAMWASGWLVLIGQWLAAAFPPQAVGFHHLVFIGGYGLLTLAIGTRVILGHGRFPLSSEGVVLSPLVVIAIGLAFALRVAADGLPARAQPHALAASAAMWILAWLAWSFGAGPRMARVIGPPAAAPTATPPR